MKMGFETFPKVNTINQSYRGMNHSSIKLSKVAFSIVREKKSFFSESYRE